MSPEPAIEREATWQTAWSMSTSPEPATLTFRFLAVACCRLMSPEPATLRLMACPLTFLSSISPEPLMLSNRLSVLMSDVATKSPLPTQSTLVSKGELTFTTTLSVKLPELKMTLPIVFFGFSTEMFSCLFTTSIFNLSISFGEAMRVHSCVEPWV